MLVADLAMLRQYAADVPDELEAALAAQTRPTTYILPASRAVAPGLVGPDGTVGLRVVQDEFCHKVVRRLGTGWCPRRPTKPGSQPRRFTRK